MYSKTNSQVSSKNAATHLVLDPGRVGHPLFRLLTHLVDSVAILCNLRFALVVKVKECSSSLCKAMNYVFPTEEG